MPLEISQNPFRKRVVEVVQNDELALAKPVRAQLPPGRDRYGFNDWLSVVFRGRPLPRGRVVLTSHVSPPYVFLTANSAAVNVFRSSIATVITPTPPGTGVIAPATSLTGP